MTDYHSLIARAVAGLDRSSVEARRKLYERAREALVSQLRRVEPAPSDSVITKERLALEDAIRKVEAEARRGAGGENHQRSNEQFSPDRPVDWFEIADDGLRQSTKVDDPREIVRRRLKELPKDVVAAIQSPHRERHLRAIGERRGLTTNQLEELEDETLLFMLGFEPLPNLARRLAKALCVSSVRAHQMAKDIEIEIFTPIRQSLDAFFAKTSNGNRHAGQNGHSALKQEPEVNDAADPAEASRVTVSSPSKNAASTPKEGSDSASSRMNDVVRQKLRQLIVQYGSSVADDHRRCEALLRDLCSSHRREVNVLVHALKSKVVLDLSGSRTGLPVEVLYGRLVGRLQDEHGLAEDVAQWAVHAWAFALELETFSVSDNQSSAVRSDPAAALRSQTGRGASPSLEPDLDAIIFRFTEAIRADPENADAHRRRGHCYTQKGDHQSAVADYNKAIEFDPRNELNAQDGLGAIASFTECLRQDPQNSILYRNRAIAFAQIDEYDRASTDFKEAIRLCPNDALAHRKRGAICTNTGYHELAITHYDEAIRLNPSDAMSYANRGLSNWRSGQNDKAIRDWKMAIKIDPDCADAYYYRAGYYSHQGEFDLAINDSGIAIRLDPNDWRSYERRGYAYIQKGDYKRAIVDLNESIRLSPDRAWARAQRARAYNETGGYLLAIADCDEALRLNSKLKIAYGQRGWAKAQLKEYDDALADFNELIALDPKEAWNYGQRGVTHTQLQLYDQAIADLDEAIRIDPNLAWLYGARGFTYKSKGAHVKAVADFNEALRLDPRYAWVQAQLNDVVSAAPDGNLLIRTFKAHSDSILSIAFAPDGRTALTGSRDRTVKLWDLSTGQEVRSFRSAMGWLKYVTCISIVPDGHIALFGSNNGVIKLCDISSGRIISAFKGHSKEVTAISVNSVGTVALSGSRDTTAKVWNLATGREIRTLIGHKETIMSAVITPDGRYALTVGWDASKVWDISTGDNLLTLGRSAIVAALTPDGQRVFSGGLKGELTLWELVSGREIRKFSQHNNWVNAVAVLPHGRSALSGSSDTTLKQWDLANGKEILTLRGDGGAIEAIAIAPDGLTALSGSVDGTLNCWSLA